LAAEHHFHRTGFRVLGYGDGFQHALVVDVARQALVYGQVHALIVERRIRVADQHQGIGLEEKDVRFSAGAIGVNTVLCHVEIRG